MSFGGYRLIHQLGAGRDGISYRALAPDDSTPVEIRDLSAAHKDPDRWAPLVRRLRLCAQLDHPSAIRVRETRLDLVPPFVALEWSGGEALEQTVSPERPLPLADALRLFQNLAGVVASAHRIGLVHGRIDPATTRLDGSGIPRLDFTRLEAGSTPGPERLTEVEPDDDRPGDVFRMGQLLAWLVTGSTIPGDSLPTSLGPLLGAMLAADPEERPTAREVEDRLKAWIAPESDALGTPEPSCSSRFNETLSAGEMLTCSVPLMPGGASSLSLSSLSLGRYRLREVLGAGGQGIVYRAEDSADGSTVAVKVLRPEWASSPEAARRFRKEARLMAKLNNPFMVNLLDYNDEDGVAYLVMEFVTGRSLGDRLDQDEVFDEPAALAIAIDTARALEDAHAQGIVHRDVKPANILLNDRPPGSLPYPRVRLSDFGLARHIVDTESLILTAPGSRLGTPHYMSPEQITGRAVDPRTDVYALGATLFHMLCGRPPFVAETREALHVMHLEAPPPSLRSLNEKLSDGICRVVERALAKSPDDRYPDAAAMRRDLERLARGEPTSVPLHPVLPACDPRRVLDFEFRWELAATPRQLWPHVTNTDRLDRALGFAPVQYSYRPDPSRKVRLFGEGVKAGMAESWEEYPYEWVEPRRMGVLREYSRGPFHWLVSTVELTPRGDGGTTLVHRLRLEPRGWKVRVFSPIGVGSRFRAALSRIYERVDATLTGKLGPSLSVDPFEATPELDPARRERLESRLDRLAGLGLDPTAIELLGDLLARGSPQELARLRPLVLARRWRLDPEPVLDACLHAAREGLLVLLWDILCPTCRVSCAVADALRAIREHGRCEACQANFELDFRRHVELIFRVHPEIREADTGLYCAGGPAHAPHVVAQVRVAAGERFELELALPKGAYQIRGPQLPWSLHLPVQPAATRRSIEIDLVHGPAPDAPPALAEGGQVLTLTNTGGHELLARLEREAERDDALSAMQAFAFAPFRDLYPGEALAPGQVVVVTSVTLLATALDDAPELYRNLGETRAFTVIHDHFRLLDEVVRRGGGTLVKTIDEGIVAAFPALEAGVAAALELHQALAAHDSTRHLGLRVAIHHGSALVSTLDGRLDYFGAAARRVRQILQYARGGQIVLTTEVAGDPGIATILHSRGIAIEVVDAGAAGLLHRLTLPH